MWHLTEVLSVWRSFGAIGCLLLHLQTSSEKTAAALREMGIPTRVILDSAVGYVMDQIDLVLLGAEAVVENGGIVNKVRRAFPSEPAILPFTYPCSYTIVCPDPTCSALDA